MTKKTRLLSGNYQPKREAEIETKEEEKEDPQKEFERRVTEKLGGSFAFVRGKKFIEPATKSDIA